MQKLSDTLRWRQIFIDSATPFGIVVVNVAQSSFAKFRDTSVRFSLTQSAVMHEHKPPKLPHRCENNRLCCLRFHVAPQGNELLGQGHAGLDDDEVPDAGAVVVFSRRLSRSVAVGVEHRHGRASRYQSLIQKKTRQSN